MITADDKAWAYLCDDQGRAIGLTGSFTDGQINLAEVDGGAPLGDSGAALSGVLANGTFKGSLRLDGQTADVVAEKATGDQGVYMDISQVGDTTTVGAWIRDAAGVVGNKTEVATTSTADGGENPAPLETAGGSPPPNVQPLALGDRVRCFMASRRLVKASAELEANPSTGAAANQHRLANEAHAACDF